jgi:hypothetical protein
MKPRGAGTGDAVVVRRVNSVDTREPDWTAVDAAFDDYELTVRLVANYFGPVDWRGQGGFTGAWFERFDGGGDRPGVSASFTATDLAAVTLLSG